MQYMYYNNICAIVMFTVIWSVILESPLLLDPVSDLRFCGDSSLKQRRCIESLIMAWAMAIILPTDRY